MRLSNLMFPGLVIAVLGVAASPASAFPSGVCPSVQGLYDIPTGSIVGTASDCTVQMTITDATLGAPLTVQLAPGNSTAGIAYEGDDDVLVGVLNSSTGVVPAITLSGVGIFAFDGDGISIFTGAPTDIYGYAGPNNIFGTIPGNNNYGVALFTTPLQPGDTAYFSLEFPPQCVAGVCTVVLPPGGLGGQSGDLTVPEPASLALLGGGLCAIGLLRRRRR